MAPGAKAGSVNQGQGTCSAPLPEERRYVDQEVWALLGRVRWYDAGLRLFVQEGRRRGGTALVESLTPAPRSCHTGTRGVFLCLLLTLHCDHRKHHNHSMPAPPLQFAGQATHTRAPAITHAPAMRQGMGGRGRGVGTRMHGLLETFPRFSTLSA